MYLDEECARDQHSFATERRLDVCVHKMYQCLSDEKNYEVLPAQPKHNDFRTTSHSQPIKSIFFLANIGLDQKARKPNQNACDLCGIAGDHSHFQCTDIG